jgi:hypothetical protein
MQKLSTELSAATKELNRLIEGNKNAANRWILR